MKKSFNFKKGEKVYYDGELLTISNDPKLNICGIHMICFKGKGIAVGENYVKRDLNEPDKRISECIDYYEKKEGRSFHKTTFNTISMRMGPSPDTEGLEDIYKILDLEFYQPTYDMVKWLKDYSNNRFVCHVGSGNGHLIKYLKGMGVKRVAGIEPNYDANSNLVAQFLSGEEKLIVVQKRVEDCKMFFEGMGNNLLVIVVSSKLVKPTIKMVDKDTEVLFISKTHDENVFGRNKKKVVEIPTGLKIEEKVYSTQNIFNLIK